MYDLIIIGSGPAGISAAQKAREAGAGRVAVVESAKRLGGECPNWGCIPTKALLRSAEVLDLARRGKEFGLRIPKAAVDLAAVMRRKRKIMDLLTGGTRLEDFFASLGVEVIRGQAHFVSPSAIDVGGRRFESKMFVVATGSRTSVPKIDGLAETRFWTSVNAISAKRVPKELVILGGGAIGCEMASLYKDFGSAVTIIESGPRILPREDAEIVAAVAKVFAGRGIRIITEAKVLSARRTGRRVAIEVFPAVEAKKIQVKADVLLVASGKRPDFDGLDLAKANIKLDERGAPILDPYLRSTNEAVYFAGDAAGRLMLTNVAHEMGEIAAENAVSGTGRVWDTDRVVPHAIFSRPEVGSVGLTEQEARDRGLDIIIGSADYMACGKSLVRGDVSGMVKIIADRKSGLLLGAHAFGSAASEIIHEAALAIQAHVPVRELAAMIYAFPTYAECLKAAAGQCLE